MSERSAATISDDGRYRYGLARVWDPTRPPDLWTMLNPSTADHLVDDPTVRRVRGFSTAWGAGGFSVVNRYAYRATSPRDMWAARRSGVDIIGPDCDHYLRAFAAFTRAAGGRVILAWGAGDDDDERTARVRELLGDGPTYCLGATKSGAPRHPLYVRADQPLVPV